MASGAANVDVDTLIQMLPAFWHKNNNTTVTSEAKQLYLQSEAKQVFFLFLTDLLKTYRNEAKKRARAGPPIPLAGVTI